MNTLLSGLSSLVSVSAVAILPAIVNLVFYLFDREGYSKKALADTCIIVKGQIQSQKIISLKIFMESVKNNFDNAEETTDDAYSLLINSIERLHEYLHELNRSHIIFKFLKKSVLIISVLSIVLLVIAYIFPFSRIVIVLINIFFFILVIIANFCIDHYVEMVETVRAKPDLITTS